ncbi:MAG: signal peptidase I [Enterococcus faecalis]|nr:signal peptidase I [Enterococcus faecalis]MDU4028791.1 signal peptidase I [Enterococcus faecalis]
MSLKSKELIKTVVFFACLALGLFLLRQFVFTPVVVRGHSMDPTLADGERVITLKNTEINRFDIITFPAPDEPDKNYIKRVIGLPGEAVRYENDQLYVNNQPIAEPYLTKNRKKDHETMPYTTNFDSKELLMQEKLPKDSYFVLGDNRRMSKDSRSFGAIHADQILGKAQFVYYPLTHMKIIPK